MPFSRRNAPLFGLLGSASLLILTAPVQAQLSFNFTPASGTPQNVIDGFNTAALLWTNALTTATPVTVNVNIAYKSLGSGILGSTGSTQANYSYTNVRNALLGHATSLDDTTSSTALSTSNVNLLINRTSNNPNGAGSATPYLDNTGANTTTIRMTDANAKALGLYTGSATASDASITFSSNFTFDFNRNDGITAGSYDFVGVAAHEIGHSLGFISGVDILDGNGSGNTSDDGFTYVSTLDLFRFSTDSVANGTGVIDWTADNRTKYFSLDGGVTPMVSNGKTATMSTGQTYGNRYQASHWANDTTIGIMAPALGAGKLATITGNDLRAFDVIGYGLKAPVPAPASLPIFAGGLIFGGVAIRRRKR